MKLVCLSCQIVFLFEGKTGIRNIIAEHRCPRCEKDLISYKDRISKKRQAWRYPFRKVYIGYKATTVLDPVSLCLNTVEMKYWSFPNLDDGGVIYGEFARKRIKLTEKEKAWVDEIENKIRKEAS